MKKSSFMSVMLLTLAGSLMTAPAKAADTYPDKPIRVILPWSVGGPTDVVGRAISTEMGEILGQRFIIESRSGASGTIGTAAVAQAKPDGYTVLMNASVQVIYPGQFKSLSFDPIADFETVGILGTVPMVAIVPPESPFQSFNELIEHAKANPGALSFGSPGVATLPHLVGELVNLSTQADIAHIGYRGSNPALTDLAGGHIDLMYAPLAPAMPLIESKRVRPLAVTPGQRLKELPDVPTIAETAVPDFDIVTWYGMWVPKGTPESVIKTLNDAMVQAAQSERVIATLEPLGTQTSLLNSRDAHAFALKESERWIKVMQDSGLQPE